MSEPLPDETPIALLFARDPLKHSEQDIDRIIAKMREARHTFKTAGKPAPKLTKGETAAQKLNLNIDIGDL